MTGLQRYSQLKAQRRQERKTAWQTRRDAEDEYSESINQMIEEKGIK